ncbi:excinuclease ABC subunit C [Pontibacter ruber]|uniref:Excinuclease ABC subunit C n=1 Tax=Pontibacter ruber TaxID=1343895 RepID=A0ABW5CS57_9BACT|nr:excinuclease ABC subunit C [Pontibacter ruber]
MEIQQAHYFVYIFGNQSRSDLQIGIADNLHQHVKAQRETSGGHALVYYEHYDIKEVAQNRERQIKGGSYEATFRLVESMNPNWLDLSDML